MAGRPFKSKDSQHKEVKPVGTKELFCCEGKIQKIDDEVFFSFDQSNWVQ